jgi:hypothetical protein
MVPRPGAKMFKPTDKDDRCGFLNYFDYALYGFLDRSAKLLKKEFGLTRYGVDRV